MINNSSPVVVFCPVHSFRGDLPVSLPFIWSFPSSLQHLARPLARITPFHHWKVASLAGLSKAQMNHGGLPWIFAAYFVDLETSGMFRKGVSSVANSSFQLRFLREREIYKSLLVIASLGMGRGFPMVLLLGAQGVSVVRDILFFLYLC